MAGTGEDCARPSGDEGAAEATGDGDVVVGVIEGESRGSGRATGTKPPPAVARESSESVADLDGLWWQAVTGNRVRIVSRIGTVDEARGFMVTPLGHESLLFAQVEELVLLPLDVFLAKFE